MSIIQRPTKQGNATTYQGKVAAGYTKILASEVDADLDLIYSAWNQGVDAVNIRDNSITGAKLQAGSITTRELFDGGIQSIDLADGSVTTTKIADGNVTQAKLAVGVSAASLGGGRVIAGGDSLNTWMYVVARTQINAQAGAQSQFMANSPGMPDYVASEPGYYLELDYGGDTGMNLYRRAANSTAWTNVFAVRNDGGVDGALNRLGCYSGGIQIPGVWGIGPSAGNVVVGMTNRWWDTASMTNAGAGQLVAPPVNSVVYLQFNAHRVTGLPGGISGLEVHIQFWDQPTTTWKETWGGGVTGTDVMWLSASCLWPAVPSQQFRVVMTNPSGYQINWDAAEFSIAMIGRRP